MRNVWRVSIDGAMMLAKRSLPHILGSVGHKELQTVTGDIKTATVAANLAAEYNSEIADYYEDKNASASFRPSVVSNPKLIDFIVPKMMLVPMIDGDNNNMVFSVEPMMKGNFFKYSSNQGFVDESRNTPNAYSHFSYEQSRGELIVVDIQGVGDVYTDPQIHTFNRGGDYGLGNLGMKGIKAFFASHRCNELCESLSLPNRRSDRLYPNPNRIATHWTRLKL